MAYKYYVYVVLCLFNFVFSVNSSDESELTVRFDAELYSSEHFNVSYCRTRKSYYEHVDKMIINIEIYYKSDFNITALDSCTFWNTTVVNRHWSVQRLGDVQFVKISLSLMPKKLMLSSLTCIMKLNSKSSIPTSQLRCQANFVRKGFNTHYAVHHSGDIEASVSVDLNKPYIGHELAVRTNTSLLLKCQGVGILYKYSVIIKDTSGKAVTFGSSPMRFIIDASTAHKSEYGCMKTYIFDENDRHQATLRLKYIDDNRGIDHRRPDEENNSNDIGWLKIVLITSGCFVAAVLVVTSVSVFCGKGKRESIINDQDDNGGTGVPEEIENSRRGSNTFSSLAPSPPTPPPSYLLFTLPPEKSSNNDDTSPPSYAEAVSQRYLQISNRPSSS